jgi:hypothetical protein
VSAAELVTLADAAASSAAPAAAAL